MKFLWMFIFTFISLFSLIQGQEDTSLRPPIKIGMVVDLSKGASGTGKGFKHGAELYLAKVNAQGGIQGRKIEIVARDDEYEPLKSARFVRQLIKDPEILLFMGNTGAPNMEVTIPIITEKKIILFAASTGASILRKTPPDRYVFNLREGHIEEAEQLLEGAFSVGFKPEELVVLTQNDPFGDAVFKGVIEALKKAKFPNPESIPHGRYVYNTLNVEEALATILTKIKQPPKVILLGGNAPGNAKFLNLAHPKFPNAIFLIIGGYLNISEVKNRDEIVIIADQLVPPLSSDLPAVKEYREDLKTRGEEDKADYYSLQGYLAAKLLEKALEEAIKQGKLTREGLVDVFESLRDIDIGVGITISFDKDNHQAFHTMWPTLLKDGVWVPLENWSDLKVK